MTSHKARLTVTVDPDLVDAGNSAVAAGLADSLSGWVNAALAAKAAADRKLRALAGAVADYEAEFGEISDEEIASQLRADHEAATVIRGQRGGASPSPSKRRRRGAA
jgi:hypothetical protein